MLLRFKYMDIQPRFVKPSYKTFTLDPAKLKDRTSLMYYLCPKTPHFDFPKRVESSVS